MVIRSLARDVGVLYEINNCFAFLFGVTCGIRWNLERAFTNFTPPLYKGVARVEKIITSFFFERVYVHNPDNCNPVSLFPAPKHQCLTLLSFKLYNSFLCEDLSCDSLPSLLYIT